MSVIALGLGSLTIGAGLLITGTTLSASVTNSVTIAGAGNGSIQLVNDTAAPGASAYYGTDGAGTRGWFSLTSGNVSAATGTAGQVLVNGTSGSAQTGAITLTLATALVSINSITSAAATDLTLTANSGASLVLGNGATGGVGIGGTLTGNANGLKVFGTTASTSTTTGSLVNAGGFGNAGAAFIGGNITVNGTTDTFNLGGAGSAAVILNRLATTFNLRSDDGSENPLFTLVDSRVNSGVFIVNTRTGAVNFATSGSVVTMSGTTTASTSLLGALVVGNGSAATSVGIGGGNINAGGSGTFGSTTSGTSTTAAALLAKSLGLTENLVLGGGLGLGVASVATAAGTTVLTSASKVAQVFTGTTTQSVTLPAANAFGSGTGLVYVIKNRSTGAVTINRAGSDLIDGATSFILPGGSNNSVTLISDGASAWNVT